MPIQIHCPSCAGRFQAPDHATGRNTKCPKCGAPLVVPSVGPQNPESSHRQPPPQPLNREEPTPASLKSPPEPVGVPGGEDFNFALHTNESPPSLPRISPLGSLAPKPIPESYQLDHHTKIAALVAGVGLLIMGVSPLFKWINFATGGMIGLKGDGKIVLGITAAAMAIYIAAIFKQKWYTIAVLMVQAWATVAIFWMGAIVWKVGSIFDLPDVKDNPFAGLLVSQISPGAGLYLGLIGAIAVAAALGFIALRRVGSVIPYCGTQSVSIALGILLALFVGSDRPSEPEVAQLNDRDLLSAFPGAAAIRAAARKKVKWKKTHNVSDTQWDEMIANYEARKHPESVSQTDWWEEAKAKTPAELNKLYPPLQPHEWYRAEWPSGYSQSRELDYGFGDQREMLKVEVMITTEQTCQSRNCTDIWRSSKITKSSMKRSLLKSQKLVS